MSCGGNITSALSFRLPQRSSIFKAWVEGDVASLNEVKAMAEFVLNNFAYAIIHSAVFPQYSVAQR